MSVYTLIPTLLGQAKLAEALAGGDAVQISEIALGDSNGTGYSPSAAQTSLVNEVWRGDCTTYQDETNANWVVSEAVVPEEDGNWWVRELGLYDSVGDLIAIGRYPDVYKPIYAEGAGMDLVVRGILAVTNASQVELALLPGTAALTIESGDARYVRLLDADYLNDGPAGRYFWGQL